MKKVYLCLLLSCLLFFTVNDKTTAQQAFTDQASAAGINLVHDGLTSLDLMSIGTGAVWFDFDNDEDLDLYITMRYTGNKLYENNNNGTFTEIVGALGADNPGNDGAGVAAADINNDGFLDLYLANGDEDRLFLNVGGTSFTDITASAGFDMTDDSRGTSATWGDYDNDGFLDLYVTHHNRVTGAINWSKQDKLYYNNGDTTFTDVSHLFTNADLLGSGFIGGWTDYDLDGDLDIFLVNDCLYPDFIPTKLFRNDGAGPSGNPKIDWVFTEVNEEEGIDDCRNGMGIAVGDYDRNGYMDIYYSNVGDAVLYCNGHPIDSLFRDSSVTAGVNGQVWPEFSWGTFFFDYDLDGFQDLFLGLGSHHYPSSTHPENNMLYHNQGNRTFSDESSSMNMDDGARTRTPIFGDYDNDGDPDVLLVNFGETVQLKRNENANGNHYLWVDLEGTTSNRDGIGAKLKLTAADNTIQYFETRSGSSLGGGDQIDAHFGLGTNTSILELVVTWPSGIVDVIANPPIDTKLKLVENVGLDVSLSIFTAQLNKQNGVDLKWTTVSEENNHSFAIQRSTDGRSFLDIGTVAGKGTTTDVNDYYFLDASPIEGINYYRLKQIDFDASVTFSEIRQVALGPENGILNVYPNPIADEILQVEYKHTSGDIQIEIVDGVGSKLFQQKYYPKANEVFQTEIDLNQLQAGIYVIIVENAGTKHIRRVVKN